MATKTESGQLMKMDPKLQSQMAFAVELSKSGLVPMAYIGKPANIFAASMYGRELGIPTMTALQNIAVINGKPTIGTDMLLALAMRHPEWAGYEIKESTDKQATVVVSRKYKATDKVVQFSATFTYADAQAAGLVRSGGPWEKWKKRMLKHRATAFAVRDAFPDAMLAGLYTGEEMDAQGESAVELQAADLDDAIHASILDEKGIPVDIPVTKVAPKATRITKKKA